MTVHSGPADRFLSNLLRRECKNRIPLEKLKLQNNYSLLLAPALVFPA